MRVHPKKRHIRTIFGWTRIYNRNIEPGGEKMTQFKKRVLQLFMLGLIVVTSMFGCSGDESDSGVQGESGDIVVSLTDAAGDFVSYKVDVLSITLFKANGTVVNTLPLETTVDFAQYTDMTEFLTAATIPLGKYVGATLTLDYRNADIWVENANGDAVKVTTILDEDGNALTTLTVTVNFPDLRPVRIVPAIPAHLTLDFDLNASNTVVFDAEDDLPQLTVAPVLIADINPLRPKIHRLRGPIKNIYMERNEFTVILRPFYHALSGKHERFGRLTVKTTGDTVYDINGTLYTGENGLLAMTQLNAHTGVVVVGDLYPLLHRFRAREVYAGTSIPGGTSDAATGNVISCEGNTLTLQGASIVRSSGSALFNDVITVMLGEDTMVSRQLSTEAFSISDISVGQRISVFGDLTIANETDLTMDATSGFIRMMLTTIQGTVVDDTDAIIMNLQSIDKRPVDLFDFSGTGTDAAHDADPENYEVNTGTLNLPAFSEGDPLWIRGFVSPFGQAPRDFDAWTIIDVVEMPALLKVLYEPGTEDPFELLSAEGMVLNLENIDSFHHVAQGETIVDLSSLSASPVIQPSGNDTDCFLITYMGITSIYPDFDVFVSAIEAIMDQGQSVRCINAKGTFDEAASTFTADVISVGIGRDGSGGYHHK